MSLGSARLENISHHLGIAVRSLNEELGLVFGVGSLFQLFEGFDAVFGLYGEVAVEGEALAVEAGAHYG